MKYKQFLIDQKDNMIEELMRFVSHNSVYDESTATEKAPFGAGVDGALEYVAKLGEQYGFEVDRCDGYCTELTIGEGEKMIGIFAHADVVPATGEWNQDPFSPYVLDGNVYGRGTSDDKGPFIAAFYAVLALMDEGLLQGYKVRFVVGGNEETGSRCLHHYFDVLKKPSPTYGFTPDADFPLIFGEKGINDFFPELPIEIPHVKSLKGGAATNAVCDKVEIEMDDPILFDEYCTSHGINHTVNENVLTILGESAHGSTPNLGINAAIIAMSALGDFYGVAKLRRLGVGLAEPSGRNWEAFHSTRLMGETTYCVGTISYSHNLLKFSVNFRYPDGVNPVEYKDKFDAYFGTESNMGEESHLLLFDPKSKLVRTLMKAYKSETHQYFAKPLTIGGGTYAKYCKNTVAFGALFPGRESVMHQPNEYMPVEDIVKSAQIYAKAIYLLGQLK